MAKALKELEMMENDWYQFDTDELQWSLNRKDVSYEEIAKAIESETGIESIKVNIKDELVIDFDEESYAFSTLYAKLEYSKEENAWSVGCSCYAEICDDFEYYEDLDDFEKVANKILDSNKRYTRILSHGDIYSLAEYNVGYFEKYETLQEAVNEFSSVIWDLLNKVNHKAQLCADIRDKFDNE